MRLIDADKLPIYSTIEGVEKSEKGTVAILGNWVSAISIEEAPTVKAIPIEWIEKYTKRNFPLANGEIVLGFIADMIEDWEKENETNSNT